LAQDLLGGLGGDAAEHVRIDADLDQVADLGILVPLPGVLNPDLILRVLDGRDDLFADGRA